VPKPLDEVMRFLENYTLAWHHWLMILGLFKLKGSATKSQLFPIYKKEGFSPHAIENVFKSDLVELGEVVEIEGGIDNLQNGTVIYLTEDPKFMRFLKKHLKPVVRTLKMRKPQ
jgi:hypothetical protein